MSTRTLREPFVVTDEMRSRFFATTASASTGCMIWTGAIQKHGYGAFRLGKHKTDAHVASWRIRNGGICVPLGQLVMHLCDVRACVNPEHLALGTSSENMLHAHEGGRGDDFKAFGEQAGSSVLTEEQVLQIRSLYVPRRFSYRRIARHLGVSERAVDAVLRNRTWRHLLQEVSR